MGLHEKQLTEEDYRSLILQEYSFLKRPVAIVGDKIYIGAATKEI
jgi:arsenate reductase